ncbi:THAP domain-containing protein 1-like [Asterias amurensis]|uniref:THAP domain-containing protein 1-like n=1 Tax=Asterias amurensis TaxID=7602 RepID=UPI003AB1CBC9
MPESCTAVGCTNRRVKGGGVSFHKFPLGKQTLLSKWVAAISRPDFYPSKHQVVCSEHFRENDYIRCVHPRDDQEVVKHELMESAVPSIFPDKYLTHKQRKQVREKQASKRPPPKRQLMAAEPGPQPPKKAVINVTEEEHMYALSLSSVSGKLIETTSKLQEVRKELKVAKQKVRRQSKKISSLLEAVKDKNMINQGQLELLKLDFGPNTFTLIENELKSMEKEKRGHRFSEEIKQFALTLHFYSARAYEFVRQYLHLPHPSSNLFKNKVLFSLK